MDEEGALSIAVEAKPDQPVDPDAGSGRSVHPVASFQPRDDSSHRRKAHRSLRKPSLSQVPKIRTYLAYLAFFIHDRSE